MASLAKDPTGVELEDFVSAHFASRGCYVETNVKEEKLAEILELDIVWTDYRLDPEERHPVEIKSGDWHLGDIFKFYGWTRYLGLEPGEFFYKKANSRVEHETLQHVERGTGINLLHMPNVVECQCALPVPCIAGLTMESAS